MKVNETTAALICSIGAPLCLLLLALVVVCFCVNIAPGRERRIPYIRSYKKGKFLPNYLIMILIFFIGILYETRDLFVAFSASVAEAKDFITLKLNLEPVSALMAVSRLYAVAVYAGYVLILLGTAMFTLSIVQQHLWNAWNGFRSRITRKEMLYLFGYNPDNLSICKSDGSRRFKYIIAKMDKETLEKLYVQNLPYVSADPEEWVESHLSEFVRRSDSGRFRTWLTGLVPKFLQKYEKKKVVIINTGDDRENVEICKLFVEAIAVSSDEVQAEMFGRVRIFVFGNPEHQAIFDNLAERGKGCVTYVNKYQKTTLDFIDKYPLTLFMDCSQIDYVTSLVRENVDINVALVGFGKTNRQMLLSLLASNQFLTASPPQKKEGSEQKPCGEGPFHKPINYFVFDKGDPKKDKNLNHNYFRFKHKLEHINLDDYLPMPENPADEQYETIDINDEKFYPYLKRIVTRNTLDANFIIISFGDDLENLDMAQKLVDKCREWDAKNVTIFVRAFHWRKEQTPLKDKNCYFFGDEEESVFNIDKLLSDKIYRMAKMRSKTIDMERALSRNGYDMNKEEVRKECNASEDELWYKKKTQIQRDSRIFACLGLRFKLNLMGLDYREKRAIDAKGKTTCAETVDDRTKVYSEEEYMALYAGEDTPDTTTIPITVNGKKIVCYRDEYKSSRRRNMAFQEHLRWSSFVISRGVVPASKHDILTETVEGDRTSGKNYAYRRHGNLTSYEGLRDFSKLVVAGKEEKEILAMKYQKDRYRYRYQILDDAYWLLDSNGFEIIKKLPCRNYKTCTECKEERGRIKKEKQPPDVQSENS